MNYSLHTEELQCLPQLAGRSNFFRLRRLRKPYSQAPYYGLGAASPRGQVTEQGPAPRLCCQQGLWPFPASPSLGAVTTAASAWTQLVSRAFVFKVVFVTLHPLNAADGFSICSEKPFREDAFAHDCGFVWGPDILAHTPIATGLACLSGSQPPRTLKGPACSSPRLDADMQLMKHN